MNSPKYIKVNGQVYRLAVIKQKLEQPAAQQGQDNMYLDAIQELVSLIDAWTNQYGNSRRGSEGPTAEEIASYYYREGRAALRHLQEASRLYHLILREEDRESPQTEPDYA